MEEIHISNLQSGIGLINNLNRTKGKPGRNDVTKEALERMRNNSIVDGLNELEKRGALSNFTTTIRNNLTENCEDNPNSASCLSGLGEMMGAARGRNNNQLVPIEPPNTTATVLQGTLGFETPNISPWRSGMITRTLDLGNVNSMGNDDIVNSILRIDEVDESAGMDIP